MHGRGARKKYGSEFREFKIRRLARCVCEKSYCRSMILQPMTATAQRESKELSVASHHFHCGFAVVDAFEVTRREANIAILMRPCSVPLKIVRSHDNHVFRLPSVEVRAAHA